MAKRYNLGDIVSMPLPTQWGPEILPTTGIPASFSNAGGAGSPGVLLGSGGAPGSAGGGYPGAVGPQGFPLQPDQFGGPQGGYPLGPGTLPNGLKIPGTATGGGSAFGSPGLWAPDSILPDWMLPGPLQRGNPLIRHDLWDANKWDMDLVGRARRWAWIAAHGGLKTCCRVPELGAPIWSQPPWQVMPSNGIEYRQMFSQPLAAFQDGDGNFTGDKVALGSWRVELGFDGVLNQFVCGFTGSGFNDFSGDITWTVQVNNRNAKNLGAVVNTFGTFADAFLVPGYGVRLVSGQTVTVFAAVKAGAGISDGVITGGTFGWTYPRR